MKQIHLFQILGRKVHDSDGRYAGCLEEIEVQRSDDSCAVESYHVHHRGLIARVTAWALSDSLRKAMPKSDKLLPYRVPWELMDLSDVARPRITVPQSQLERVRPESSIGLWD